MWVSFESVNYEVDEDRGPVLVCLEREGEISETITVTVSTAELETTQAKCKKIESFKKNYSVAFLSW